MNTTSGAELAALGELPDYRVCAEDTDPRGWPIVDSDNVAVGRISDLIIDLRGLTARYIVCVTQDNTRAVLIPTGFARLDNEACSVHLDFITAADMEDLPTFTGLPLSDEHATRLEQALTGAPSTPPETPNIVRRARGARDTS